MLSFSKLAVLYTSVEMVLKFLLRIVDTYNVTDLVTILGNGDVEKYLAGLFEFRPLVVRENVLLLLFLSAVVAADIFVARVASLRSCGTEVISAGVSVLVL